MDKNEEVLCIEKNLLPDSWVAQKSVVKLGLDLFLTNCTNAGFKFCIREDVEKDDSYKQIIPYIIIQTTDLQETVLYKRQGSEQRLHDLWSIGIGGHINPIDIQTENDSFLQILITGMERELDEELDQRPKKNHPGFVGVINENITDVGKVHLGAVFRILTNSPEKFEPGTELFEFTWKKTEDLEKFNLELWSELALELLKKQ